MKKLIAITALCLPFFTYAQDKAEYYGPRLCTSPQYECIKIGRGDSWEKLFPNEEQRDLVQRINRTYNSLWPGKEIAVPRDLEHATMLNQSPFPTKIDPEAYQQIIVDQDKLAWGAYDKQGQLVKWGPISSGSDVCSDHSSPTCRTMTGIFQLFSKEDSRCKSNVFPLGKGGAKMPFCMYFHKGLALHGSDDIPGYRASHGCVRMFTRDAKWLNQEWVEVSNEKNNYSGTRIVIRPVTTRVANTAQAIDSTSNQASTSKPKRRAATGSTGGWRNPDLFPPTITERVQ